MICLRWCFVSLTLILFNVRTSVAFSAPDRWERTTSSIFSKTQLTPNENIGKKSEDEETSNVRPLRESSFFLNAQQTPNVLKKSASVENDAKPSSHAPFSETSEQIASSFFSKEQPRVNLKEKTANAEDKKPKVESDVKPAFKAPSSETTEQIASSFFSKEQPRVNLKEQTANDEKKTPIVDHDVKPAFKPPSSATTEQIASSFFSKEQPRVNLKEKTVIVKKYDAISTVPSSPATLKTEIALPPEEQQKVDVKQKTKSVEKQTVNVEKDDTISKVPSSQATPKTEIGISSKEQQMTDDKQKIQSVKKVAVGVENDEKLSTVLSSEATIPKTDAGISSKEPQKASVKQKAAKDKLSDVTTSPVDSLETQPKNAKEQQKANVKKTKANAKKQKTDVKKKKTTAEKEGVTISTVPSSQTAPKATAGFSSKENQKTNTKKRKKNVKKKKANVKNGISEKEWEQRCTLAVSYRIAHLHDWGENIFNHITLKVDGSEHEPDGPHFLLNDFGMGFDEVTASSLLKVNLDGEVVGGNKGKIFKPGFVIHSAIHEGRPDVRAVWHCHALDTTAVCQTKLGLLPLSTEATYALKKGVSYHPYEGTSNDTSEKPRLVKNLGPVNSVLMLEDHGPLVASPTIQEAFACTFFVTKACQFQVRALSSVGGDLDKIHMPAPEILDEMINRMGKFDEAPKDGVEHDTESLMFECAKRAAEREFGAENIYV